MKISRISETKRGRFALFIDEEFLFSVDAETLTLSGLRDGMELTEMELASLQTTSETRKAKDQALRYLSLRSYGKRELYDKLILKFDPLSSSAALETMEELGLLDDESFAAEKAKGMAQRGKSTREIARKLSSLGINDYDIENAMAQIDVDDAVVAYKIVCRSYLEKLRRGERQKVMAALARRGFTHTDIRAAIEQAEIDIEDTDTMMEDL